MTQKTGRHPHNRRTCLLNNVAEADKSTRKRNYAWQRNPP